MSCSKDQSSVGQGLLGIRSHVSFHNLITLTYFTLSRSLKRSAADATVYFENYTRGVLLCRRMDSLVYY